MAAKALILSAYISLFRHRSSNSTHIIKKPIASRLMYANSDITESHRTPTGYESEVWMWALVNFLEPCNCWCTAHENLTLCFSRGQLDEAPAFLTWKLSEPSLRSLQNIIQYKNITFFSWLFSRKRHRNESYFN